MSTDLLYKIIGQLYVELLAKEARISAIEKLVDKVEQKSKPRAV
jgi:hypothetical protein